MFQGVLPIVYSQVVCFLSYKKKHISINTVIKENTFIFSLVQCSVKPRCIAFIAKHGENDVILTVM